MLTPKQIEFLEFASKNTEISSRFYLTGGIALCEFYLHHRLSQDIDLFIEKEDVNQSLIDLFLMNISSKLSIGEIKKTQSLELISYQLMYKDKESLTVDFRRYPHTPLYKGVMLKKMNVDSVYDIAISKIQSILKRVKSRDFIDLYFIMNFYNYSLNQLINDSKVKFHKHIDKVTLATQFAKVNDLIILPTMLIPLNRREMENFFISQSKFLIKEAFK